MWGGEVKPYYDEGGITIYHADCREVMGDLDDASIDLIVTDPPYGHNNNNGDLIHRRELALGHEKVGEVSEEARPIANDSPELAAEMFEYMCGEARRVLVKGACCCCCSGGGGPDPQFARWVLHLDRTVGFKHAVVWDKGGLGMGWHYRRNYELILVAQKPGAACTWNGGHTFSNVIRGINGIKPRQWEHPTPKPVDLFRKFVWLHSNPGDMVLDPFMGAGTTLLACRAEGGRRAIGIEIEEKYCEIAAKRLAQGVLEF